jgi:hypothetical protein
MQPSQVYLLDLPDCPNILESEGAELAGITVSLGLAAKEVLVVCPNENVGAGAVFCAGFELDPVKFGFFASQAGQFSTVIGLVHMQSLQL